jgi:hypothetical protein
LPLFFPLFLQSWFAEREVVEWQQRLAQQQKQTRSGGRAKVSAAAVSRTIFLTKLLVYFFSHLTDFWGFVDFSPLFAPRGARKKKKGTLHKERGEESGKRGEKEKKKKKAHERRVRPLVPFPRSAASRFLLAVVWCLSDPPHCVFGASDSVFVCSRGDRCGFCFPLWV